MTVTFSEDILRSVRMTSDELQLEIAVMLYEKEKLSVGKAAQLAGMNRVDFMKLLASRKISAHYDVSDFEQDIRTLQELGRL